MSGGIYQYAKTAVATLRCDAHGCGRRWESAVYRCSGWRDQDEAAGPAFDAGWRVFLGGRSQYTYCPEHGPKVSTMRLLHGGA